MDLMKLADEIIGGRRLSENDDLSFFVTCGIDELCEGADKIRGEFCGDRVDLCSIISGRSGLCPENCKYCAQSVHNKTDCAVHPFLREDEIVEAARRNQEEGVDRFAIVTAGRALSGEEFERAVACYERMKRELKIGLCASMGFLTREQFRRLKNAGVTSIHNNIETSRRFFPNICTTHTFDMKIATIRTAQEEGLAVCSGGIIGLGETFADRIDMALTLSGLGIRSIPINALMAIPGTPLEGQKPLCEDEIIRTLAMFRFVNPEANIRLAAGRRLISGNGRRAFESGCSASITGNMLTTTGSTIQADIAMLESMGRKVGRGSGSSCAPSCCPCSGRK